MNITFLSRHRDAIPTLISLSIAACIIGGCIYKSHRDSARRAAHLDYRRSEERKTRERETRQSKEDATAFANTMNAIAKQYNANPNWAECVINIEAENADHDNAQIFTLEIQHAMTDSPKIALAAHVLDVSKRNDSYYLTGFVFLHLASNSVSRANTPPVALELECSREMAMQLIQEARQQPLDNDGDTVAIHILVASINDVTRQQSASKNISISLRVEEREFDLDEYHEDNSHSFIATGQCVAITKMLRASWDW